MIIDNLDKILDGYLSDPQAYKAKIWAMQQGLNIQFYAFQLSSSTVYAPQDILIALMNNNMELYRKCIAVRTMGERFLASTYKDVLFGGSKKYTECSLNEEGDQITKVTTLQVSKHAIKKLLSSEKNINDVFHTYEDTRLIDRFYGIKESKEIVSEKVMLRAIDRLQPFQFSYYKIVKDYIESKDNNEINPSKQALYFHLRGGYQSGKSVSQNTNFFYILNCIVNAEEVCGDIAILSSSSSSIRRNVISRICAEFDILPPSTNSTVWTLPHGLKIHLFSSMLCSFHNIKGAVFNCVYCDELDSTNCQILDLLKTRMTGYFRMKGGRNKTIFISTSNPHNPDHHVSIYLEDTENCITKCVSTLNNAYLTSEYIERMTKRCGGESTNKFKREVLGKCVYLSDNSSVFSIREEDVFKHTTIDDYSKQDCESCSNSTIAVNKDCKSCKYSSAFRDKKQFIKCNIGYDHGSSMAKCFCCTFFYIKNGIVHAIVLDELYYYGGHDLEFSKRGKYEQLIALKENNLKFLVEKCLSVCPNVEIFLPHDAVSVLPEFENVLQKHHLNCQISRPPTPSQQSIAQSISLINILFQEGRLTISHSCKMLKSELFNYEYDVKKIDSGVERIRKGNDHAIDAMRYSIIPEISLDDINNTNISDSI